MLARSGQLERLAYPTREHHLAALDGLASCLNLLLRRVLHRTPDY